MSVRGASLSSKQSTDGKTLSPNQSLILDEIDDEDEDEFMKQRHASYGFFNRKFTRKKLKSVFPSGFTLHRVRTDRDLLPATSNLYGRNKVPYGSEFDEMRNGKMNQSGARSISGKSYHDAYRGEDVFRDDMTDSMSFHGGNKGDDFADVAGPYFHEIDQNAARKRQASSMAVIPVAQTETVREPGSPVHEQRSRSNSPERPRTAQELMMSIDYNLTAVPSVSGLPLAGVGEANFSVSAGFGEPSGSIASLGYLPPQQNKELVTGGMQLHFRRAGTVEERNLQASVKAKQLPVQSTAPFIPPSKLPPMPAKTAAYDHEKEMEERSIASLETLVKHSSPTGSRAGGHGDSGSLAAGERRGGVGADGGLSEGSSFVLGAGDGSPSSSPVALGMFSQSDVLEAGGGAETWLRRGQYTAPPRERTIKRSKSPARKVKSSSASRTSRTKKSSGVDELGLESPTGGNNNSHGMGVGDQPTVGTNGTVGTADDTLLGSPLDYDRWVEAMSDKGGEGSEGRNNNTAPSLVVNVKPKRTAESATERTQEEASAAGKGKGKDGSRSRTPLQRYLEGRLHAVRDGQLEDTTASVDVVLYSFLSLMGGASLDEATPSGRFSVSRDTDLPSMLQLVGKLAGSVGLSADGYYGRGSATPQPTLFIYQEKTKSWLPLVQPIQLRLSLLNCLADSRPLQLMYSLKFADEIDEAFYYANGRPTLEDIQAADAEAQRMLQGQSGEGPARKFSDSLGSEDIPDMIRSMSRPPLGLTPSTGREGSYASRGGSEPGGDRDRNTGTNTSSGTRTLTANNLNMKLMTSAQAQQPPKPSYGGGHLSKSPLSSSKLRVHVNLTNTGAGGHTIGSNRGGVVSTGRAGQSGPTGLTHSSSLANLGVTHIPPIKRSSSSSLHAGRGPGLADNMSREKQEAIANELQKRLLKTEWIFPS